MKRQLAVAAATVGISTTMWNAVVPDQRKLEDSGHLHTSQSQYSEAYQREQRERRAAGNDLGDAVYRDELRSREVRPADKGANGLARGIVRRIR